MAAVNGAPATRVARRLLLALHLTFSVGWVGAVLAYLVLAFAIRSTADPDTVRAAWTAMELIGWYALAPLAVLSLLSGVVLALSTRWGLFRHYWVLVSFLGTTVLTVVLLLHLPDVSAAAEAVRSSPDDTLAAGGSDLAHALGGLVLLLGILVLNIMKPAGLTRYGWRRRRAGAAARTTA